MRNEKKTQGFTLIELLIVIAIIGILAAVLIPNLLGARSRAFDTGAQTCANSLQTTQEIFFIDAGSYASLTKASGATTVSATDASTAFDFPTDELASGCTQSQIVIATTSGGSGSDTYTITVGDTRGNNTYTITPNDMTTTSGAPT